MPESELTEHRGHERYEARGRNSGNGRNGHYTKKLCPSSGDASIGVPRDRRGQFEPQILNQLAIPFEARFPL